MTLNTYSVQRTHSSLIRGIGIADTVIETSHSRTLIWGRLSYEDKIFIFHFHNTLNESFANCQCKKVLIAWHAPTMEGHAVIGYSTNRQRLFHEICMDCLALTAWMATNYLQIAKPQSESPVIETFGVWIKEKTERARIKIDLIHIHAKYFATFGAIHQTPYAILLSSPIDKNEWVFHH